MNTVDTIKSGAAQFSEPFTQMFGAMVEFVPLVLGGLFVLVLGLIAAPVVGNIVTRLLHVIKVDQLMDMTGAKDALATVGLNFTLSRITGEFVKYLILLVFIVNAANIVNLTQLSELINVIILFVPQIVIALVMVGIGLTVADWLRDIVETMATSSDNADYAGLLGSVTRISVIVFAVMAALSQMGIGTVMIQILFGGIVFAFALAFGLGAKDTVARALDTWLNK